MDLLASELDPSAFDVQVWTGRTGPGEADHRQVHGLAASAVREVPGLSPAIRPLHDARALVRTAQALRHTCPAIVHTHTAKAGLIGRLPGATPAGTKRVHTYHGHLLHGYFPPGLTTAVVAAERALARRTDRIVAVAGTVRDDLLEAGVGRPEQYAVIPPGVAVPRRVNPVRARADLGVGPDQPCVAYVGRLTRVKRPDRLVDLAERLACSHPDAVLLVAGGGECAGEVEAAARRLRGRLRLLGWCADVAAVYAAADLVVLTSANEGLPLTLVEAHLAGRPVVATPVGGVPEVVADGVDGLLAAPGAAFHEAVAALLDDVGLRGRLGEAGPGTAARFSAGRLVADTAALYRDMLRT